MDYLLPATVYVAPPRLGRGLQLNTIMEDLEEKSEDGTSDSDASSGNKTIIADAQEQQSKPVVAFLRIKQHIAHPSSPASVTSDSSLIDTSRNSYTGSDTETVFSDTCPSLTDSRASLSDIASFAMESSRHSLASRSSRNRYPALLIPRDSWGSIDGEVKDIPFGMSPTTKIRLPSKVFDYVPQSTLAVDAPPSLGDSSSIRSVSPCFPAASSLPVTPDLHSFEVVEGQSWGGQETTLNTSLEIAIDDRHSILLSPAAAHSSDQVPFTPALSEWSHMMRNFPEIPGATPQELTPVTPDIPRREFVEAFTFGNGIQLPRAALEVLNNITTVPSPSVSVTDDCSERGEMQEKGFMPSQIDSHIQQESQTPLSDYSYSRLSIPSPGGFFASLKPSTRHTWSSSHQQEIAPPSSATAQNFYKAPWAEPRRDRIVETVLETSTDYDTDDPATARQATFVANLKSPQETCDMYGSSSAKEQIDLPEGISRTSSIIYEQAYEDGIKQAAEASLDRTSGWLAAQTSYLAALRETNPLNNLAEYSASNNVVLYADEPEHTLESPTRKAVRFLKEATVDVDPSSKISPAPPAKEPLFLEAFDFLTSVTNGDDALIQSSARLQAMQSKRLALPSLHVKTLLNDLDSKALVTGYIRPKYRGPFSQNPRNTGNFTLTEDHEKFLRYERQQKALTAVMPSFWTMEAQRKVLYNGRLFACRKASELLTRRSVRTNKKRPVNVLDLGGAATGSWAWAVAKRWSEVNVCTVQSIQQLDPTASSPTSKPLTAMEDSVKATNPSNHRVVIVPHFWQLPFKSNHFDIVSARTLHMFLRARPIPGAETIDEWDMALKEIMRVLKPGGILDFFIMESGMSISNTDGGIVDLSPNAMPPDPHTFDLATESRWEKKTDKLVTEFQSELKKRGYDQDGGCQRLVARLKKGGFVDTKRQWIGLPMGHSAASSDRASRSVSYMSHFNEDGTFKLKPFDSAPRTVSEMSEVGRIITQYFDREPVPKLVGSTEDVADISALLGETLWEEWLVRLRLEAGYDITTVLEGVHEILEGNRRNGKSAWRCLLGWTRKPKKSRPVGFKEQEYGLKPKDSTTVRQPLTLDTNYAINRNDSLASYRTHEFRSAIERGDVVDVPMMIQK